MSDRPFLLGIKNLSKREKIRRLRVAEYTLQTVIDDIAESLEDVRDLLGKLGETPSDEIDEP